MLAVAQNIFEEYIESRTRWPCGEEHDIFEFNKVFRHVMLHINMYSEELICIYNVIYDLHVKYLILFPHCSKFLCLISEI